MNNNLFESTEFYHKRYQNFSTLIIIPIFILLIGILALTVCGKVDVNVDSSGIISPAQKVYPLIGNSNKVIHKYVEDGQVVKKGQKLFSYLKNNKLVVIKAPNYGVVYLKEQTDKIGYIYPRISDSNISINTYITSKNVGEINKNQRVYFYTQLDGTNTFITGKVSRITGLPQTYRGNSYYLANCSIKPSSKQLKQLRYGMNGQLSIKTAKVRLLEYLKRMFS